MEKLLEEGAPEHSAQTTRARSSARRSGWLSSSRPLKMNISCTIQTDLSLVLQCRAFMYVNCSLEQSICVVCEHLFVCVYGALQVVRSNGFSNMWCNNPPSTLTHKQTLRSALMYRMLSLVALEAEWSHTELLPLSLNVCMCVYDWDLLQSSHWVIKVDQSLKPPRPYSKPLASQWLCVCVCVLSRLSI